MIFSVFHKTRKIISKFCDFQEEILLVSKLLFVVGLDKVIVYIAMTLIWLCNEDQQNSLQKYE